MNTVVVTTAQTAPDSASQITSQTTLTRLVSLPSAVAVSPLASQSGFVLRSSSGIPLELKSSQPIDAKSPLAFSVARINSATANEVALFGVQHQTHHKVLTAQMQASLLSQLSAMLSDASVSPLRVSLSLSQPLNDNKVHLHLASGSKLLVPSDNPGSLTRQPVDALLKVLQNGQGNIVLNGRGMDNQVLSLSAKQVNELLLSVLQSSGMTLKARSGESVLTEIAKLSAISATTDKTMVASRAVNIRLSGNDLTVESAAQRVVGSVSVRNNQPLLQMLPQQTIELPRYWQRSLPVISVEPLRDSASLKGEARLSAPLLAESAQMKQVQSDIVALSRQLLNQTGSAKAALATLLSLSQRIPSTSDSPALALKSILDKVLQQDKAVMLSRPIAVTGAGQTDEGKTSSASTTQASPMERAQTISQRLMSSLSERIRAALVSDTPKSATIDTDTSASVSGRTSDVQITSTSAQLVKSILNAQPLPFSVNGLTKAVVTDDLVGALISVLQVSLASRAVKRSPDLIKHFERSDSFVSQSLAKQSGNSAEKITGLLRELPRLDPRGALIEAIKHLLANHQQSKLAQIESRLQGQDTFFYTLPFTDSSGEPCELLVKRDAPDKKAQVIEQSKRSSWNISMRLGIGDMGQVLAKASLQSEVIELDLYASTPLVLKNIANTLPYLIRKLEGAGLKVERTSFQQGYVPDTLATPKHHIFEAKV